jgi:hypothetical protein
MVVDQGKFGVFVAGTPEINVLWYELHLEEGGRKFLRNVYKHVKQFVSFLRTVIFRDKEGYY